MDYKQKQRGSIFFPRLVASYEMQSIKYSKPYLFSHAKLCFVPQSKYYGDYGKMLEILLGCKSSGCLFLVGGRMVDGVFKVASF